MSKKWYITRDGKFFGNCTVPRMEWTTLEMARSYSSFRLACLNTVHAQETVVDEDEAIVLEVMQS